MAVVRGLDIGYSNVKYTIGTSSTGEPICCLFPSFAPIASMTDLGAGLSCRRTVIVEVDGTSYEIGPDARLACAHDALRLVDAAFVDSPEYLALLRGALVFMDVPRIDRLMVGLPCSRIATQREKVRRLMQGRHSINGATVTVERVHVLAQPIGGLIDHALATGGYGVVQRGLSLIVDPGFVTLDWVVARGIDLVEKRCGSATAGFCRILQHIAAALSRRTGVELDLNQVERGLDEGFVRVHGHRELLAPYLEAARPLIEAGSMRCAARSARSTTSSGSSSSAVRPPTTARRSPGVSRTTSCSSPPTACSPTSAASTAPAS